MRDGVCNGETKTPHKCGVLLNQVLPTNNYIIQLSLLGAGPGYSIEVLNQFNNSFTVGIYNISNAPANAIWYFTVLDF